MGLDATVYCTCFRDGKLKTPPPDHIDVYVNDNGGLDCRNSDPDTQEEFDDWYYDRACEHENGYFVGHRIGNMSFVASLRAELSRQPDDFPILLSEVIYSGTHCGDHLDRPTVQEMRPELDKLSEFTCDDTANQQRIDHLLKVMRELSDASDQTGNPIAF